MNIKRVRIHQNLTQCELGQRLGISQSQVSKIENGYVKLKKLKYLKLIKALGLDNDNEKTKK